MTIRLNHRRTVPNKKVSGPRCTATVVIPMMTITTPMPWPVCQFGIATASCAAGCWLASSWSNVQSGVVLVACAFSAR